MLPVGVLTRFVFASRLFCRGADILRCVMKIMLKERGGIFPLEIPLGLVDTETLPEAKKKEINTLVAEARADIPRLKSVSDRGRDLKIYEIEIEDKHEKLSITQTDGNITPAFLALLRFVKTML
jgi:hypothetical protein